MPLEDIAELPDPADQLRADIEAAVEQQQKGATPEPAEATEPEPAAETSESRERDPATGRFVAKTEPAEEASKEAPKAAEEPKEEPAATEAPKPATRPPPGFSIASKAAWDELPQSVRDDIAKREQEVDNGFKRYAGLGKFAEEAERNGRTLQDAVTDYVAVEGALKQNFVGGIEFICQKLGVNPRQLTQIMAARYFPATQPTQSDQASPQGQQQPVQQTPQPTIDPNAIAQHVANVLRQEAELREATGKVDAFKSDSKNKYFDNVRQDMFILVNSGKASSVEEAYEAACWMNPEIRALMIKESNGGKDREAAAAASRSRNAAKAIGGAPTPGVNPDATGKRHNLSLEDEIRAAVDAQVGAP